MKGAAFRARSRLNTKIKNHRSFFKARIGGAAATDYLVGCRTKEPTALS
jgi:hypothetical protein